VVGNFWGSPNGAKLQTLQRLRSSIYGCSSQLSQIEAKLEKKLNAGSTRMMSRFGLRALKWPFESEDVNKIVRNLERYRDTLSAALNVDQTYAYRFLRYWLTLIGAVVCRYLIWPRQSP
jgi:hypothetical protein